MRTLCALLLSLIFLNADLVRAQQAAFFDPSLHLGYSTEQNGVPTVYSAAQAVLDSAIGTRLRLFGYATPLRNGQPAQVGYHALAELDSQEAGGNRDGVVDASDARFADLCVWVDRNRDGVSQPQEMSGLDQAGVASLDYRYRVTQLRDSYGNLFRYVSTVKMRTPSGVLRSWPSFDVIFTEP